MGYRKKKLDCASMCSDARSRGQPRQRANLLIMLILRDKNSVLILCIIIVAVFLARVVHVWFGIAVVLTCNTTSLGLELKNAKFKCK